MTSTSTSENLRSKILERRCVVFTDADNTLWDTNEVYADAQLSLLEEVERRVGQRAAVDDRLEWIRRIDQMLAERHHTRLSYPPRLLVKALGFALKGEDIPVATRLAWSGGRPGAPISEVVAQEVEANFVNLLKRPPQLRAGVAKGFRQLGEAGCLIVVLTEGRRHQVKLLLEYHGLESNVTRVIEAPKNAQLFSRVLKLTRPLSAFMIGDQLDRDIAPAKAAGLTTIFFPGKFQPRWLPTEAEVAPDYKVWDFDEAARLILALANAG
jgi:putative hydrolase of the HAD superfamily